MRDDLCELCGQALDPGRAASTPQMKAVSRLHLDCPVCRDWDEPGPRTVSAFEPRHGQTVDVAMFHPRCWDLYDMVRVIMGEELPGHTWTRGDPPSAVSWERRPA